MEAPTAEPSGRSAVNAVFDLYEENHVLENVNRVGAYLEEKLDALAQKYEFIVERRGLGLMQGLVFDRPVGGVITKALDRGLILINAGANIIRFVPPLVIFQGECGRNGGDSGILSVDRWRME